MLENQKELFFISCDTGCSCCATEYNHYRGFYLDKASAERRINYYLTSVENFAPVRSQFHHRGRYYIIKAKLEKINNDRFILGNQIIIKFALDNTKKEEYDCAIVLVDDNGKIQDNEIEKIPYDINEMMNHIESEYL